jgi:hypothetical protein
MAAFFVISLTRHCFVPRNDERGKALQEFDFNEPMFR